ncbi:hypothetical protein E2562_023511 [Oryza meyeriana var. granulata]|uniref:Uncharacterized protein n=1 Tax=Oryza meyeriana var. granulata TaxID=110450 RepID=A0A6G1BZ20_9ORYZ|nr:hypothetical protein E2562_023511 [Oryza meyeriana var. granulata]
MRRSWMRQRSAHQLAEPAEVRVAGDEVEEGGASLGEVEVALACVAVTNTSRSHRQCHQSARRLRRKPRAAHRPVEDVEDGGAALREVVVEVAAHVAGEARDGEDWAMALGEVDAAAARMAAETMAMNQRRSSHGGSRY